MTPSGRSRSTPATVAQCATRDSARSDFLAEVSKQGGQPSSTDRQDPVDRRLHDDLPITAVALPADLADTPHVDRPLVVDPLEAAGTEDRIDLAQGPDIANRAAAAFSDDRVVAVRLEQVDVVGIDGDPAQRRDVQQNSMRQ